MDIYSFSKGQIITMFCGIGFFIIGASSVEYIEDLLGFSFFIIMGTALVVYIIGWRNNRKKKEWEEFVKSKTK